jgi:hypothetical protein
MAAGGGQRILVVDARPLDAITTSLATVVRRQPLGTNHLMDAKRGKGKLCRKEQVYSTTLFSRCLCICTTSMLPRPTARGRVDRGNLVFDGIPANEEADTLALPGSAQCPYRGLAPMAAWSSARAWHYRAAAPRAASIANS